MKILVKFYVFDLPPGFSDAELEVPVGSTVADILDDCLSLLAQRQVSMDENELKTATVLVNGKWSDPGVVVADGETITIIRPLDGG